VEGILILRRLSHQWRLKHQKIEIAHTGEEIGLKVEEIAREGYEVYKLQSPS